MCGCGQRSGSVLAPSSSSTRPAGARPSRVAAPVRDPILEYVGPTSLVITGPVTGRTYRFEQPGARVRVSVHDAAALLQAVRAVGAHQLRPRT